MYRSESTSDLWNRKGHEGIEELPRKLTPRIDAVIGRLTPESSVTFVEASHPKRAIY